MPITVIPTSIGGLSLPGSVVNGPLANLYRKLNGVDVLQYPRDLQSSARGHVVQFTINEVQPIGLQENKEYDIKDVGRGLVQAGADAVESLKKRFLPNTTTSVQDSGANKNINSTFNTSLEPRKKTVKGFVSLYMPDTVSFSYENNYNETTLLETAQGAAEFLAGMGSQLGKGAKNILSAVDSNVGKLALKTQGLAINPNQQLLFDGVNLRNYQLSFTFTPYSKQETETVKKIINLFKEHSRPRTVNGSGGMLFIPPSTFNLDFQFNGKRNEYVNRVAESVITDIEVNYAPNGWAAHTDGAPVQITMTLSFKELYIIDRAAVKEGY